MGQVASSEPGRQLQQIDRCCISHEHHVAGFQFMAAPACVSAATAVAMWLVRAASGKQTLAVFPFPVQAQASQSGTPQRDTLHTVWCLWRALEFHIVALTSWFPR